MLFFMEPRLSDGEEFGGHDTFMKGIASASDYIFIGGSNGVISVLAETSSGFGLLREVKTASGSRISCLSATTQFLVAGNEVGELYTYEVNSAFDEICFFKAAGYMVTSVCAVDGAAIAAYSSGHIRLFRVSSSLYPGSLSELAIELSAHSRCINALALHPEKNMFASCGEDHMLYVWELTNCASQESCAINLIFHEKIDNRLLTGATFLGDGRLAVASYDEDAILLFCRT